MTSAISEVTIVANDEETKYIENSLSIFNNSTSPLKENAVKTPINSPEKHKFQIDEKAINPSKYFMKKESFLSPGLEKKLVCVLSLCVIVIVWCVSIGAITIEVFIDLGTMSIEYDRFNVTTTLEKVLNNLTNQSLTYDIDCPNRQVHSGSALFCSPSCTHWDIHFNDFGYIVETVIILIIDIIGVILGVLTLITWPFVKSFWKFPQVTILFLVICITLFILTFAIVDFPGFYCGYDAVYSFNDLATNFQDRLMSVGAIIHFLRISIMFWTLFTLLNIFISTLGPVMFKPNAKFKIIIVTVECIISFGIPLIYIIVVLSLRIKLFWNIFGYLPDYTNTAAYMLGRIIPDYATAIFSLTLTVLILARVRFMAIDSKRVLGNSRKLTPLETRLIIYSVVSSLIFYCFIVQVCVYFSLFEEDNSNFYNYRACITLNSPITVNQGNSTFHYNSTYELIPESVWDGGMECEGVKTYPDNYHPFWGSLYNVCYRVLLVSFFLMFILKSNILIWIGVFKRVWKKLKLCFNK